MDETWARLDERHPARRMRTRTGVWMAAVFLFVAITHAIARDFGVRAFVGSSAALWAVWIASVLAHELGHVLAARLVGLEPLVLIVGGGPSLLLRDIGGVAVDLGVLPGGGFTMFARRNLPPTIKWRLLFAYAGGPLVSLALFTIGLSVFSNEWRAFRERSDSWIDPGTCLVLVNGFLLFTSLVPLPRGSDVCRPRNDLLQMLMLPQLKPAALEGIVKAARSATVLRLFQLRKYQDAHDEALRELARDPTNWVVRVQLADMLIFVRRYADAAREYGVLLDEPALSHEGVPPVGAAFVANNYAWANYMLGDDEGLAFADGASAKAVSLLPKHPSVIGTRGAVLVARGEVRKGRELLERARRLHRDARSRASNLACLGLAELAEQRADDARRLFEQARKLDPDCEVLLRVPRSAPLPRLDAEEPRRRATSER